MQNKALTVLEYGALPKFYHPFPEVVMMPAFPSTCPPVLNIASPPPAILKLLDQTEHHWGWGCSSVARVLAS